MNIHHHRLALTFVLTGLVFSIVGTRLLRTETSGPSEATINAAAERSPASTVPPFVPPAYSGRPTETVLDESQTEPDADGRFQITRIVAESQGRFALLRVKEDWQMGANAQPVFESRKMMVADQLLVRLTDAGAEEELEAHLAAVGARILYRKKLTGLYVIGFEGNKVGNFERVFAHMTNRPDLIRLGSPNFIYKLN